MVQTKQKLKSKFILKLMLRLGRRDKVQRYLIYHGLPSDYLK